MGFIVIAIILGLVLVVGILMAVFSTARGIGALVASVAAVLLLLMTIFSSASVVDARAVGINTAFGRYSGTLDSGLHWTAPWSSVEQFSTTLQSGDLNDKDGSKNSVYVAFSAPKATDKDGKPIAGQTDVAGGGNGNISAVVYWQISQNQGAGGAKALWEKYRTFDKVRDDLVIPRSAQIIGDVANDYTAGVASVNQTLIADSVKTRLASELSRYGIVVDSVSIKGVDLDPATRASLQRIVDNINKTTAATEEQKRAVIDNQTAKLRAESGALNAAASQRYCLDIVNSWDVSKNGPLPATFNCGLGNSSGVIVNSK